MSVESFDPARGAASVRAGLFLMTKPDEAAARRLQTLGARLRERHGLGGLPTRWDRLHVTLAGFGRGAGSRQAHAVDTAMSTLRLAPFRAMLDRVTSWNGAERRPMVATADEGVVGLVRLHEAIGSALAAAGVKHGRAGHTPHVTLLRDRATIEETFIAPIAWTVEEVQLVFSVVEARRHVVLNRWRLRG